MSDLNYCLNKQSLRKLYPVVDTDKEVLLFSLGYATQTWLAGKFGDASTKEIDGIVVTPDSLVCPECGGAIE